MAGSSSDPASGGVVANRGDHPGSAHGRRRRRLRVALWRYRYLTAALALGLATVVAVEEVRPRPPALMPVVTLAAERPAGATLGRADLAVAPVPAELVPDGALADPGQAAGSRLAVGLPAGYPLSARLLLGPGLADGAPPGTVVVPVRLADPGVAAILGPGDRIDIHRAPGDGAAAASTVLARRAVVLARAEPESAGWLGAEATAAPLLLVAVPSAAATLVTGAGEWNPLGVVLVAEDRPDVPD